MYRRQVVGARLCLMDSIFRRSVTASQLGILEVHALSVATVCQMRI